MKYCTKCGAAAEDNQTFCGSCGNPFNQTAPKAPLTARNVINPIERKKLHCPRCKSHNFRGSTESTIDGAASISTGSLATTGFSTSHRDYWICADCGTKFRNIQSAEEEYEKVRKRIKPCAIIAVISAVISVPVLGKIISTLNNGDFFDNVILYTAAPLYVIPIVLAVVLGIYAIVYKNSAQKLESEIEYLKKNCFD